MTVLDYDALAQEVIAALSREKSIVLATSAAGRVTARTMSHVNDRLTMYFQTGNTSDKYQQITANPNIALAVRNMQIEATAEICGHPSQNFHFCELYKQKFPQYYELYTNYADETVIKASPVKIALYKYIDGVPCRDILDIEQQKAYRI